MVSPLWRGRGSRLTDRDHEGMEIRSMVLGPLVRLPWGGILTGAASSYGGPRGHLFTTGVTVMKDVCSPVTRKGSKVGSNQPLSPGARSAPGGSRHESDSVPGQSSPQVSRQSSQEPAPSFGTTKVTGPEE